MSESASFICIKIDVVNEKRSIFEGTNTEIAFTRVATCTGTTAIAELSDVALFLVSEFELDANFVVLKSNKGKSETRVPATLVLTLERGFTHPLFIINPSFRNGTRLYLKPS